MTNKTQSYANTKGEKYLSSGERKLLILRRLKARPAQHTARARRTVILTAVTCEI